MKNAEARVTYLSCQSTCNPIKFLSLLAKFSQIISIKIQYTIQDRHSCNQCKCERRRYTQEMYRRSNSLSNGFQSLGNNLLEGVLKIDRRLCEYLISKQIEYVLNIP